MIDAAPRSAPMRGRRLASAVGMEIQAFALAARPEALAETLDDWINAFVPPEVAIFRPLVPAVMCSLLHYPQLGDVFAWETGVFSQNEMYFAIPVGRWRREAGRERLVEVGVVTPYIFVDNAESAAVGRGRFGFPKEVATFARDWGTGRGARGFGADEQWSISVWDPTPSGRCKETLCRAVSSRRTIGALSGELAGARNLRMGELTPLLDLARAVRSIVDFAAPRNVQDCAVALQRLLAQGRSVTIFNLRQFGHPQYEGLCSYQDLVRFRMRITNIRELGAQTGAFRLDIARTMVRPIVDRLGLRVATRDTSGDRPFDSIDASTPLVAGIDADVDAAERLCWRHGTATWLDDEHRPITPVTDNLVPWSNVLGPSQGGAFLEENAGERVLDARILLVPIPVDAARRVVAERLPDAFPGRVTPLTNGDRAALRLLFYRARGPDVRAAEDLVWLDGAYASLTMPVRIEPAEGDPYDALFELAEFTDNEFLLQALRELALADARLASFDFAGRDWLSSTRASERALRVTALSLDRERDSLRLAEHPVIDVCRVPPSVDGKPVPDPSWDGIWKFVRQLRPLMTCGRIDSPTVPSHAIVRRVCVSDIQGADVQDPYEDDVIERVVVALHASRSDPVFDVLGLPELQPGDELDSVLRGADAGRVRVGHPVRSRAVVLRALVSVPRVVWEERVDPIHTQDAVP